MTLHVIRQIPEGGVTLVDIASDTIGLPVVEIRAPQNHTTALDAARLLELAGNQPGGWPASTRRLLAPEAEGKVKLLTLVICSDEVGEMQIHSFEHEAPTVEGLPARNGLLAMAAELARLTRAEVPGMRLRIGTLESMLGQAQGYADEMEARQQQAVVQRDTAIKLLEDVRAMTKGSSPGRPRAGLLGDVHRVVAKALDARVQPPGKTKPASRR